MSQLSLTNVINVSVSQPPVGLGAFNINNIALFDNEVPINTYLINSYGIYVSPQEVALDWGTGSEAYAQAVQVFSQQPSILAGGGQLIIFPMNAGETLAQALVRCTPLIFFCGIISNDYPASANMLALAQQVQSNPLQILYLPSTSSADLAGVFTQIYEAGLYQTRCLYNTQGALTARLYAASYAGRAQSVNFSGSNTAITMNLKQLAGVVADPGITQTVYGVCQTAGVDIYVSYAGISAVVSNGANKYYDEVYNLIWFVSAIMVAGFNALLQTGTKIPQTEPGMSYLKSVYRAVCAQAVNNGYVAPGVWNSPDWFGNQTDMANNILQSGYYIYSMPVNQQAEAQRLLRQAPLVQLAIKEAGAIQETSVVVNINP